ncbi:MAG: nitroreductase family protein [Candidatus Nanoarchaeia archaeon]|nr:nitroreductase family protein [Candidatus Nanoarchaeia archaeon]
MELQECIAERGSVRKYLPKKVPIETLGEIMEFARLAPSAGNSQNWRFVIVLEKDKREKIAEAANKPWMKEAPVHVVVCNFSKKLTSLYAESGKIFSIQDCAIISSYIQLLAVDKGLSTCWVGAFDEDKVKAAIKCPDDVSVEAVITMGHSAEEEEKKKIRNEFIDLCFFEKTDGMLCRHSGLFKEKGYLYFLDKDGNLARAKMARGRSAEKPEQEVLHECRIKREPGWLYYVDRDMNIARAKMARKG